MDEIHDFLVLEAGYSRYFWRQGWQLCNAGSGAVTFFVYGFAKMAPAGKFIIRQHGLTNFSKSFWPKFEKKIGTYVKIHETCRK